MRASTLQNFDMKDYDVLVLPSGNYNFSDDGLRRLKDWIRNGGTLITLAEATRWAARDRVGLLSTDPLYRDGTPQKDRLGVTGYCWGGGQTWRIASQSADVKAAVPFYGGGAPPPEELKKIKAAVLGVYGGTDERVNASIPAAETALKEAGITYQIKIYPGVGHAFHNDTGANYNAEAAKDAWAQTIAWFDKYLKA